MALWCTIALIIANGIWSFCLNIFFCTPVRKSWLPDISGSCLDKREAWLTYSGANIFLSCVLMVFPLPAIAKLQLHWKIKIALVGIFSLGAL